MFDLQSLLEQHRARAERVLNRVRAGVLLLLATAALAYAPTLPRALNWANVAILAPTLAWTFAQWVLFARTEQLPGWLSLVNPVVDISAVTLIMAGYGIAYSPELALRSPIMLAYFAILAARPMASSTRRAAAAAVLVVAEYGALLAYLVLAGHLAVVASPLVASAGARISLLDEGAKLLLLGVAGAVSTAATAWHERLLTDHHAQSLRRSMLERELASAQLDALRHQLQPHFLFNTLNTITALVRPDPERAERVIVGLSDLLRMALRSGREQEVPLERELALLGRYVEIQQVRFPGRLTVHVAVDDAVRGAHVPTLLLQPLVENAIRHGLAPRATGGTVEVRVERSGERLRLFVTDDGIGERAGAPRREGVGLGTTRARLHHLYGDAYRLEAGGRAQGGFAVYIEMPLRESVHREVAMAGGAAS